MPTKTREDSTPTIAELRAIAGPNADALTDAQLRRAYWEGQAYRNAFAQTGLDPDRIVNVLMDAKNAATRHRIN